MRSSGFMVRTSEARPARVGFDSVRSMRRAPDRRLSSSSRVRRLAERSQRVRRENMRDANARPPAFRPHFGFELVREGGFANSQAVT